MKGELELEEAQEEDLRVEGRDRKKPGNRETATPALLAAPRGALPPGELCTCPGPPRIPRP